MQFNNPIIQLAQLARGGGNVMQAMQNMAGRDKRAALALKMMAGKNKQQIYQMVCNMCKERGTTPAEVARSLGLPFDVNL